MHILVIAATKFEIAPLLPADESIEVLITGIGVPSTLYHLQKKLQQNAPGIVIQAGIAGSFTESIPLGQVVLVKKDTFADIGMEENGLFKTVFESGFADKDAFPFTDGWLINQHNALNQYRLPIVKAITINKVSDSLLQLKQTVSCFDPDIESMEGAALHYTCLQENIPFIQMRGISNFVGERDKTKWKLKESVINLNTALHSLIETLIKG